MPETFPPEDNRPVSARRVYSRESIMDGFRSGGYPTPTFDNAALVAGTTVTHIVWTKERGGRVRHVTLNGRPAATVYREPGQYRVVRNGGSSRTFPMTPAGMREAFGWALGKDA